MFEKKAFANKVWLLLTAFVFVSSLLVTGCKSTDVGEKNNGKAGSKNAVQATPLTLDSAVTVGNLDNGMTYYIRHNEEPKNRIILRLVVKAGSCMEEEDQQGIAHFIEHLAFNGTEHFEKSAIVDYFERIGMNFGADLNAYTSFEETVYKLEIPADDPEILKQALLILRDWACAVSFPQEEIDKERGVVNEEWRLRQGLQGRISDKQVPLLLKDSMFEKRLPIGKMDIVNTVSRERILDFYNKWYRPDLMSVIAVGDIDTAVLEDVLKQTMQTIPAKTEPLDYPEFKIPYSSEREICRMSDPEQKYTIVNIYSRHEAVNRKTVEEARKVVIDEIITSVLDQRLSEITNTMDAPWIAAGIGENRFTNSTAFYYLGFVPKQDMFMQSEMAMLDEYDRLLYHGVTESELERFKKYFLSEVELYYTNKDKINSAEHADTIISYILTGKSYISAQDYYDIFTQLIPSITLDEVNAAIPNVFPERGTKMFVLYDNVVTDIPDDYTIQTLWTDYASDEITAYKDDVEDDELMERPSKKGKVSSKKEIAELGVTEYRLNNGIRIITKQTDFEANTIYMKVSSKGGLFYLKDEDIPSAKATLEYAIMSGLNGMTYNQLIKKITSKQVNLNFNIYDTKETFDGACRGEDTEALLQLMNLMFSKTQFNDESWQTLMNSYTTMAKNHGQQPNELFDDKICELLYGKDIRRSPFNMDFVEKMNPQVSERIYHERFANPADFTFTFVGDFDEENLIELCCYYLGTLKTSKDREETVYKYWDFPKGKPSAVVEKGLDQQGRVYMCFGGKLPASKDLETGFYESEIMEQLEALFDIRLREVIREDKSGSYGIGLNGYIDGYPERFYRFEIDFGCEPERCQELADTVISVIKDVQTNGVGDIYIEKLRETSRRSFEVYKRNNKWWINKIDAALVFDYEPLWLTSDTDKIATWITPEALHDAAVKYLNTDNYVTVFLKPEK